MTTPWAADLHDCAVKQVRGAVMRSGKAERQQSANVSVMLLLQHVLNHAFH
jgi:hypothetical protein